MLYKRLVKTLFFLLCLIQNLFSSEKGSSFPYPIDIVYLWVDGSDPNWLSIKNSYSKIHQKETVFVGDACIDSRFLDHEELKYSLRSLVKFAPFFGHIYIITMNQRPNWLLDHPQITIVDHQEIFNDLEDLPTFNSQSIEAHLHRIPGLSEHFIYFNDDVLLGKKVSPYDFFTRDGKINVLFERGFTVSPSPEVQSTLYRKAWVNSNRLLDTYFMEEPRRRLSHAPFALRKSLIQEVECLFPCVFRSNSSHKFRTDQDFNLTNGLLQYIWLYQGYVERGRLTNKMISCYSDERFVETKKALDSFLANPLHTFCIQDCTTEDSIEVSDSLKNFFETLLPEAAPWEKLEIPALKDRS
jgi:hypothetical protein